MENASRVETLIPHITCSNCYVEVPLDRMGNHQCNTTSHGPFVEEPEEMQASIILTPAPETTLNPKPSRPSLPRLDPSAHSRIGTYGELTPVTSNPTSATASPISPGTRSFFPHPSRKVSAPVTRRPPSPELLSQDCAFPHFPTNKPKKKDVSRSNTRGLSQVSDSSRSRPFDQEKMRSMSVGSTKTRLRQGTGDSSRPSTATSSRQQSTSSRAGSRQGSVDTIPPLPLLQQTTSQASSDPGPQDAQPGQNNVLPLPIDPSPLRDTILNDSSPFPELGNTSSDDPLSPSHIPQGPLMQDYERSQITHNVKGRPREPSYRAERPPPIPDISQSLMDNSSSPGSDPAQGAGPSPPTSSSTLARTLTSIFGRRRRASSSSKKGRKPLSTDGPRFVALSPDPDPQEAPLARSSSHSSLNTEMAINTPITGVQEVPRALMDVRSVPKHIPQPSQAQITLSEDIHDLPEIHEPHDSYRDTVQMEQDLEARLAAMKNAPQLSIVDKQSEDLKRASIDSASSYGSIGFSHSSTSSRSLHTFDGHSQGSSISTARTTSSSEDFLLPTSSKVRNLHTAPDSPTDPLLQHGRLAPVPESISTQEQEDIELDIYSQSSRLSTVHEVSLSPEEANLNPFSQSQDAENTVSIKDFMRAESHSTSTDTLPIPSPQGPDINLLDFPEHHNHRRPSTPGAFKGMCRGCTKPIVGGQKSISSKDGRLTGKYHKECFVCTTCNEQFATADFYVHNDQPFCAHHYHVLNETLCESCGTGIEGQYFETSSVAGDVSKKFHSDCLKCATCRIQLDDDYFEFGGRVYCEKDAFRMASSPRSPYSTTPSRPSPLHREYVNSGDPGKALASGRFPERRLTKLMTT